MASNKMLGICLFLLVGSLGGYVVYNSAKTPVYEGIQEGISQGTSLVNQGTNFLTDTITKTNDAGDTVTLSLSPAQVQAPEQIMEQNMDQQIQNYNGTIQNSTLAVARGETYGHTNLYDRPLPDYTYFVGNPVDIRFKLAKVIPETCHVSNGILICEYVQPAIFKFTMEITCFYRSFCTMDAPLVINNKKTDNTGEFSYTWQTGNRAPGTYMIIINANSEAINPKTLKPHEISLSQEIILVTP